MLSALPLISGGNLCCCLWIVSGGVVAAYVLQQNQTAPIAAGDGALVGLLAGVAGAFVYLIVSIPINLLVAPLEQRILQRLAETMNNMPPEFREYATRSTSGGMRVAVGDCSASSSCSSLARSFPPSAACWARSSSAGRRRRGSSTFRLRAERRKLGGKTGGTIDPGLTYPVLSGQPPSNNHGID